MTGLALRCTRPPLPSSAPPTSAFEGGARLRDPGLDQLLAWGRGAVPNGLVTMRSAPLPAVDAGWSLPRFPLRMTAAAAALSLGLAPMAARAQDEAEVEEPDETDETDAPRADEAPAVPTVPAPPVVTGPPVDTDLSFQGSILWQAMVGMQVKLYLEGDLRVSGLLLAQAGDEVALAREDGVVMRLQKELVESVRVLDAHPGLEQSSRERSREPRMPPSGRGTIIAGGILTGVGATFMTMFALGTAVDSSFAYYGFPLPWIGSAMISPGIPLLALGLAREEKRADIKQRALLRASVGPTLSGGWSGRLSLTF